MGTLHPIPTLPPQGRKGLATRDWMNEERVAQQVREGLIERARQMSSRGKPGTGYVGAAPLKAGQAKINWGQALRGLSVSGIETP